VEHKSWGFNAATHIMLQLNSIFNRKSLSVKWMFFLIFIYFVMFDLLIHEIRRKTVQSIIETTEYI